MSPHSESRCRVILFSLLLSGCIALSASAAPPTPPDDLIDADKAFVGDILLGLEFGEPGSIYGRDADVPGAPASSTKSWAMHLVTEQVEQGFLALDDIVTLSSNALNPRCHGHSRLPGPDVPAPGDQYLLIDLLYGLDDPSASDGTLGAAEWLASVLAPGLATGAEREAWFVDRINGHAAEIGLDDTTFANPYGGDHAHTGPCVGNDPVVHETTAREMARWFSHAMSVDGVFRALNNYRGQKTISTVDGTKSHAFNNWNPSYKSALGQKPGGNGSCTSCWVQQARRNGREMVVGVLNATSGSADGGALLDYAYAKTFYPTLEAGSPKWKPVSDHALAIAGDTRAVSAVLTEQSQLEVLTWTIDPETTTIERMKNGPNGPCNPIDDILLPEPPGRGGSDLTHKLLHQGAGWGPIKPGRAKPGSSGGRRGGGPGNNNAGGLGYGSPWKPQALDIEHVGGGNFVIAVSQNNSIQLSSWGLPACGEVFLRHSRTVPHPGGEVSLQSFGGGRFALGALDSDLSSIHLSTWRLDVASGEIAPMEGHLGFVNQEGEGIELAASQLERSSNISLVSVSGRTDAQTTLGSYTVDPAGMFSNFSTTVVTGSRASVTHVRGFSERSPMYAMAYSNGSDQLVADVFTVNGAADITRVGRNTNSGISVGDDGDTAIESYAEGGFMIVSNTNPTTEVTTMSAWSIDPDPLGSANSIWDPDLIVSEVTSPSTGKLAIERLPTGLAEGDFLVAQRDFFEPQEPYQIELYRSGPRQ